jgi:gliding motility-associated-like protein
LLGEGVKVISVNYFGDSTTQVGYFTDVNGATIGLDSGIVMSTGNLIEIDPNFTNQPQPAVDVFDSDLLTIANQVFSILAISNVVDTVRQSSIIEFEFVPESDSIEFNYVFGSQEYPNYNVNPPSGGFINQEFNDVFGFFISGPGITGSFSSPSQYPGGAQNIAFVPGTSPQIPITVSSIHNGDAVIAPLNQQYFQATNPNAVGMNGRTVTMTAKMLLTACDTFHIKLAIGDGQDLLLNSYVFLEAKSFGSPNIKVEAKPAFYTLNSNGNLYEGCGIVELAFTRYNNISAAQKINIKFSGTAQNGIDYSFLPDSVVFNPGQSTAILSVNVLNDGIIEGKETLIVGVQPDTAACVIRDSSTTVLEILDPQPLLVDSNHVYVDCLDDSLVLTPLILQGIEPFYYSWSNGDSSSFLSFNPPVDTSFNVTVTDACGIDTSATFVTGHISTLPLTLNSVIDSINCVADSLAITPMVTGGSKSLSYLWSTGQKTDSIKVKPNVDTKYYVTVTDFCDSLNPLIDSVFVRFFSPLPTTSTKNDTISCTQSDTIIVDVQKGSNQYSFLWSNGSNTQSAVVSSVGNDTIYYVTVTDQCLPGVSFVDSVTVFEINEPLNFTMKDTTIVCGLNNILIGPVILTGSAIQQYVWSNGVQTKNILINPFVNTKYYVTVSDFCDSLNPQIDSISVNLILPNPTISTKDDTVICTQDSIGIGVYFQNGSGLEHYLWSTGDTGILVKLIPVNKDSTYYVTVTDQCLPGVLFIDSVKVFEINEPLSISTKDTILNCNISLIDIGPKIITGGQFQQYEWNTGDKTQSIKVNPSTTTKYFVTVTDSCFLSSPLVDSILVTVTTPVLTIVTADTSFNCPANNFSISVNVLTGQAPISYQWSSGQISSSFVVSMSNDTSFIVTVTDGCGTSSTDTLNIIFNLSPDLVSTMNDTVLACLGDTAFLNPFISGGTPPYQYIWVTGQNSKSISVVPESSTNYIVQISDECSSVFLFDTVTVSFAAYPRLNITANDTTVGCSGDTITLVTSYSGGLLPYSFWWSDEDSIVSSSDTLKLKQIFEDQVYYLTLIDGCGDDKTDTLTVGVAPQDLFQVYLPEDTTICKTHTIQILALVNGGYPPYQYSWSINGSVEQQNSAQLIFSNEDNAEIGIEITDNCNQNILDFQFIRIEGCEIITTNIISPNGDGINDYFEIPGINVYDEDNAEIPSAAIDIFNRWGQTIFTADRYQNNWDANGIVDGVYYYVLYLSNGKIIKGDLTLIR